MIIFADTGEVWTFRDVSDYSKRAAHFFRAQGLHKGDAVALYMTNKPKFIGLQLGLARLGVVVSLVNCNLKQEASILG